MERLADGNYKISKIGLIKFLREASNMYYHFSLLEAKEATENYLYKVTLTIEDKIAIDRVKALIAQTDGANVRRYLNL